jgi:hypothetical protein
LQALKHGRKTSMVQVIDVGISPIHKWMNSNGSKACSTSERHLVASGGNDKRTGICIWEKKVGSLAECRWAISIDVNSGERTYSAQTASLRLQCNVRHVDLEYFNVGLSCIRLCRQES